MATDTTTTRSVPFCDICHKPCNDGYVMVNAGRTIGLLTVCTLCDERGGEDEPEREEDME